jgi:diaminohydroxyphosphoribosylaminopyrimidine deaminase / 5-amino-6-(5-phosphoribosylamino)uracil reductase
LQALPVAGGAGRKRRKDAMRFHGLKLHPIATDEFAVEAWMEKEY